MTRGRAAGLHARSWFIHHVWWRDFNLGERQARWSATLGTLHLKMRSGSYFPAFLDPGEATLFAINHR